VVVSLVAAPAVWADPGAHPAPPEATTAVAPGWDDGSPRAGEASRDAARDAPSASGEAPGSPAGEPQDATASEAHGAPQESHAASEDAAAPPRHDDSDASHGSVDDAGDHGNSEPAGEHGRADDAPGHDVDRGAAVAQSADASSAADQHRADNGHHAVRIDKPGNGHPVDQRNEAAADAAASVSAAVDDPDAVSIEQAARADAAATQSDVANVAVTVRVGSGGDDGAVSQTNAATGSASANTTSDGPSQSVAEAQAAATQDDAANAAVSVRVFSPGDDGPVTQRNDVTAHARADDGDGDEQATALQSDVSNTNVSIRVESPGEAGQVVQQNAATAEGTTAVAVTTDALDTNISVSVTGSDLDRPGAAGLQIWEWDWTWLRDESESLSGSIAADVASWNWSWDEAGSGLHTGHGTVTSKTATAGESGLQGGSWSWTWDWARSGMAGWDWQWAWQETLSCGTCVWIWNWSWSWTGAPTASAASPSAAAGLPAPVGGQLNASLAVADARATVRVAQTASQEDGGSGAQFAGQLVEIVQDVSATATAQQTGAASLAGGDDDFGQANVVRSDAAARLDASATQNVEQMLDVEDGAVGEQWSGQQVDIDQIGSAQASASQVDTVLTGAGRHEATGSASAGSSARVAQEVVQGGLVGGGTLDQWAGQLTLLEQLAIATASVAQAGTSRSRHTGATARASGSAGGVVLVDQSLEQTAARAGGTGSQEAEQLVYVAQEADARATTDQLAGTAGVPTASSAAIATNRAAVAQSGVQRALGSSGLDHQELLQQSIVVQLAHATSTSAGGVAGTATVVNCAVTQQSVTQLIGATSVAGSVETDLTGFCLPTAALGEAEPPATAVESPPATGADAAIGSSAATLVPGTVPVLGAGIRPSGRPVAAPLGARGRSPDRESNAARPGWSPPPAHTGSSALPSTQARLDTRPGSDAGAGDAGKEPPLPPAGGPPAWVSAFAAAATGAGPSGIAAILLAFVLVPPLVLRAREGSVVRRPASVFARIDVPV
jgi:hypothetical protein